MKWDKETQNPGYNVLHAIPDRDPNTLYVISKKNGGTGLYKVYVREAKTDPLRTIFVDKLLRDAKKFVDDLETLKGQVA